jgi:hypothetical protein
LDYLDHSTKVPASGEGLRSWQSASEERDGELSGETIKILYDGYLDMEEGYWDNVPVVENNNEDRSVART